MLAPGRRQSRDGSACASSSSLAPAARALDGSAARGKAGHGVKRNPRSRPPRRDGQGQVGRVFLGLLHSSSPGRARPSYEERERRGDERRADEDPDPRNVGEAAGERSSTPGPRWRSNAALRSRPLGPDRCASTPGGIELTLDGRVRPPEIATPLPELISTSLIVPPLGPPVNTKLAHAAAEGARREHATEHETCRP